ncbi:MAG TPA: hypothetical protein VF659_10955 [Pyrinomonadaceae bacterium]|jgi:hypothetical protein
MYEKERTRPSQGRASRERGFVVWPGSRQGRPRREPTVRVVFHGLLCLSFDGSAACRVGTHNTSAGPGHSHPHRFVVDVWEKNGGVCPNQPTHHKHVGNPKSVSRLDITATNPELLDGTYVYARDTFTRPDPADANDPNDWRWVVDFDRLYPAGVSVNEDTLLNGVKLNNGLFYTVWKTCSKFLLRPSGQPAGPSDIQLGSVAHYIAADIFLRPGDGVVTLSGGPFRRPLKLPAAGDKTYQVDITNNCTDGHNDCQFDPAPHNPKERRNDFFLYYDVFAPRPDPEYEMVLAEPCAAPPDFDRVFRERGICSNRLLRSSDDAPCGAVGVSRPIP